MFVLAHLSDPHLAPLPKPTPVELLGKRVTGYLNWRKRRLIHRPEVLVRIVADLKAQATDHIAVTGDLINISLPGEYPPARAFLQSLGTAHDVTFIPGNHDVYVRAAVSGPQAHWGDYMRGDAPAATPHEVFPSLRRRGPLALIGVSSAVPTPPFFATGRVGEAQLARLARLLEHCGCERLCRVVLIHHPPLHGHPAWIKRLVDAAAVGEVLARHGAELVLHGHDHAHEMCMLAGPGRPIPVIGVPSASEAPPGEHDPAGYNLYRIEQAADAWRIEMVSRGLAGNGNDVIEVERRAL